MVPQPRRQNPQHQALTTTLKNICRDYPAGGGILRELLQNADDAGASELAFSLDSRSHQSSNLLSPGLSEYQGPALLAFNNAKFAAKDFESLASLGASRKEQDAFATGRFGRGFSSVFNWTDCPSIVSGRTLFFLDPHHSWSAAWHPPGGPEWDFTAVADDDAMKNQLTAYSSFLHRFDCPFEGTIIRIPLRTPLQAQESAIRDQETTILDVQSSMEGFGTEIRQGGLLFLRNVTKVVLSVDDKCFASTEVMNKSEVVEARACVREGLRNVQDKNTARLENIAFDIHFQSRCDNFDGCTSFSVHHVIEPNLPDKSLVKWAAMNKLYPWVGLAAPLEDTTEVEISGDIFTVLRLHIPTKQPVHIHGLFSISPDRGKLHGPSDAGVQDQRPQKWNTTLFEYLVPQAWAMLLGKSAAKQPDHSAFHLWPQEPLKRREMWDSLCSLLVSRVSLEGCPIWYTDTGYVSLRDGLLASEYAFPDQRQAFRDAGIPVIYLNETILKHAINNDKGRKLCQRTVFEYLRSSSHLLTASSESKIVLLEYLSSELPITEIAGLAVFPFEDGTLQVINQHGVFLHRDTSERELFGGTPECNLDIDKLSAGLLKELRQRAAKSSTSSLRLRKPNDLQEYCDKTAFESQKLHKSLDLIEVDQEVHTFVYRVWKWITSFSSTKPPLTAIGQLSLLPLTNGKCRKVQPESASLLVTYTEVKNERDIMMKLARLEPGSAPLILDLDAFPDQSTPLLRTMSKKPNMAIRNAGVFIHFLEWLVEGRHLLEMADSADKKRVLDAVVDWFWSTKNHEKLAKRSLRQLCIFKWLRRGESEGPLSVDRSWTDVASDKVVVGLKEFTILPPSTDTIYIDATNDRERGMIEELGLFDCLTTIQMIEKIVLPSFCRGDYCTCPRDLLEIILRNFYHYSADSQASMAMLPIIPLDMHGLGQPQEYAAAVNLIDPAVTALRTAFFDDEFFHPEPRIYQDFADALKKCGLKTTMDRKMVLDRLSTYTSNRYTLQQLSPKIKALLQLPLSKALEKDTEFLQIIGTKCWLPARSHDQTYVLTNSTNCRDQRDFHLVGQVLPTLPFIVGPVWRLYFHWQDPLTADRLASQLISGIEKSDLQIVNSVLSYMAKSSQRSAYLQTMSGMKVIWSSEKCFVKPQMAYQGGCVNLVPYLYDVEPRFWSTHSSLLGELGVHRSPTSRQLLEIQQQMESTSSLTHAALKVALEITTLISLDTTSSFANFKIPSDSCVLISIKDIAFNDLGFVDLPDKTHLTHPGISREIADRLHVEPLSERILKGDLGISDFDEEEFDQREEVTDGIRDTLERYPKESTFHEYLANADDCGNASKVNWLLDETTYAGRSLITPELAQYQGPSLLVHNDGVFKEKDFEGLKHVGRGSKRDDTTTIGKFGRGSQTMYHWTDVPMILSGEFLLILDPQQLYLPMNYRTRRRKAGVKIKLVKLRRESRDQLAPFDGLWEYTLDLDRYEGTIFRFPLRKEGSQSELLETSVHSFSTAQSTFQDAFETARLSLLFLRNIRIIDLRIRGKSFGWEVRTEMVDNVAFSGWLPIQLRKALPDTSILSWTDRWWRTIEDLRDAPDGLQHRHKRTMKQIECGIAVLVSSESSEKGTLLPKEPAPRFFNCLPLQFQSHLPVHVHATFLLSGDRQNISVEDTARDAGSEWNKWILETAIPQHYLCFLEDVGRIIGAKVFSLFPTKGSTGNVLSDLVRLAFWNLLPTSRHRLYPIMENGSVGDPAGLEKAVRRQRQAPKLVDIQEATFDLLGLSMSRDLMEIFPFWFKNVVKPTATLQRDIGQLRGIRVINPSLVRKALQSKESAGHLMSSMKRGGPLLKSVLCYVTPQKDADWNELKSCGILPLADGTLGTLVARSIPSQLSYFSINVTDQKLFLFAASIFVCDEVDAEFTKNIKGSECFNVYTLNKGHIGRVLEMKQDWPTITDQAHDEWLVQFWTYMDERCPTAEVSGPSNITNMYVSVELQLFPLHKALCESKSRYASLLSFPGLPAVIAPASPDEQILCLALPGLYLIDPETVPACLLQAEEFLSAPASFCRLLKAISVLASRQEKALADYVRATLHGRSLEILQQTVVSALIDPDRSIAILKDVLPLAQGLPVWISNSNDYLTACDALAASNNDLVSSWSPNFNRFVHPSNNMVVLKMLGVTVLDDETMLKDHVLESLPSKIDSRNQASYLRVISAVSASALKKESRLVPLLRKRRLAASRDGIMVKPSELYDHTDEIFVAAFRHEAGDRFLLENVGEFHSFWLENGLHYQMNGTLLGSDYVTCLYAILKRLGGQEDACLEDACLEADVETVLGPLCEHDYKLRNISSTDWSLLADIKVFPPLVHFGGEPQFRRQRMESLAGSNKALSLGEIMSKKYIRVCWSQAPFSSLEPSSWVLQLSGSDYPSCAIVWQHLDYLANIASTINDSEVELFLQDLVESYEYLQTKVWESKESFHIPKSAIWLNVDNVQSMSSYELRHSWQRLDHLILISACDAPPLMAARSFLTPFTELLRAIGCKSMMYPTIKFAARDDPESMASRMNRLRLDGFQTDITFSVEGIALSAHKVVLAAKSEYCKSQFNGSWSTRNVVTLEGMTPHTLENLIDYIYQDSFDWTSLQALQDDDIDTIADKLDRLLDILVGADRWLMQDMKTDVEQQVLRGNRLLIRADNVREIRHVADQASAKDLKEYCKEFEKTNAKAVCLANSSDCEEDGANSGKKDEGDSGEEDKIDLDEENESDSGKDPDSNMI